MRLTRLFLQQFNLTLTGCLSLLSVVQVVSCNHPISDDSDFTTDVKYLTVATNTLRAIRIGLFASIRRLPIRINIVKGHIVLH